MQYLATFCFSFTRSFPLLLLLLLLLLIFRQSLRLHSRLLRFCSANPSAFTRSFPLETHTKFLRRKTFVQCSGLEWCFGFGPGAWWQLLKTAFSLNNTFSKLESVLDCALYKLETKIEECARCRGRKAKTTGAYLST